MATERFSFAFEPRLAPLARAVGVRDTTAGVELGSDRLHVHFGPWSVDTAISNVASVERTGPYRPWKVAGPPHVSAGDFGLTFATTTAGGLCIRFRQPVAGLDPWGLLRHPSLTVTVADIDGLEQRLAAAIVPGPGPAGPPPLARAGSALAARVRRSASAR